MKQNTAFSTIPPHVLNTLTSAQKEQLKQSLAKYFRSKHSLDLRGTLPIPFLPKRAYFVLLAGLDRRGISRAESALQLGTVVLLTMTFVFMSTVMGLTVIYLLKSFLGIDLFTEFSLGVWR